jgi:hypothetical protein
VKVVTLRGTYDVDLSRMKVVRPDGTEAKLQSVPSPVVGEWMTLNDESTEQVVKIEP